MKREITKDLASWYNSEVHPPILLRGARQVGKSYIVEEFAQQHSESQCIINFEKHPQFINCFTSLEPKDIIEKIYLTSGQHVIPQKTLLFLDEIQECPQAIMALRYFKEDLPDLHVIAAGSLLEFTLNDDEYRMPVGRVQSLYLKPLSFNEYLNAADQSHLLDHMQSIKVGMEIESIVHEQLVSHLQKYLFLGGMPDVVREYLDTGNLSQTQALQTSLMTLYRSDFGKYASKTKHRYMQKILERAPGLIGEHCKYVKIDPDVGSRELKVALSYLKDAGLIHKVRHSRASGLPLNSQINEKNFKLLMLDVGLVNSMSQLSPSLIIDKDILQINRGALAEQFVGQELLANSPHYLAGELFYWERENRGSQAEVDYVINIDDRIIPIEVKSGRIGSLKSLQLFLNEKQMDFGIRLSMKPLSFKNRVLSIPLYMISEIPRLVREHC